jgi:hypothetical protein
VRGPMRELPPPQDTRKVDMTFPVLRVPLPGVDALAEKADPLPRLISD